MESLEFIHQGDYPDERFENRMRVEEEPMFLDRVVQNFLQFLNGMGFYNYVEIRIHMPHKEPEVYSNHKSVTKD